MKSKETFNIEEFEGEFNLPEDPAGLIQTDQISLARGLNPNEANQIKVVMTDDSGQNEVVGLSDAIYQLGAGAELEDEKQEQAIRIEAAKSRKTLAIMIADLKAEHFDAYAAFVAEPLEAIPALSDNFEKPYGQYKSRSGANLGVTEHKSKELLYRDAQPYVNGVAVPADNYESIILNDTFFGGVSFNDGLEPLEGDDIYFVGRSAEGEYSAREKGIDAIDDVNGANKAAIVETGDAHSAYATEADDHIAGLDSKITELTQTITEADEAAAKAEKEAAEALSVEECRKAGEECVTVIESVTDPLASKEVSKREKDSATEAREDSNKVLEKAQAAFKASAEEAKMTMSAYQEWMTNYDEWNGPDEEA